ncbi:hypothetical protein [Nocardioides convexus]|uniref:hypothetical protein n=1 Tax=Nocardioides convexus TaxID=2712224 RepID=UPI00241814A4|nr:hypothetical protein [Nocardioides convexus]
MIVHGRLNHRPYVNKSGIEVVAMEIDAFSIGHDLNRGTATFVKSSPAAESSSAADPAQGGATAAA